MIKRFKNISLGDVYRIFRRGIHRGDCPVCEKKTLFYKRAAWLRDNYHCIRCGSIPRQRALLQVMHQFFPDWRDLKIHESSPGGATKIKFMSDCQGYLASQFFPDVVCGTHHAGFRCEDLSRQTFDDESFDLVITQDVLEHLIDPVRSLKEICRTLKPGGAHIFTVPWYPSQATKIRAVQDGTNILHIEEPDYHMNPVDDEGSLVVTEWGYDLIDTIYASSGMVTTAVHIRDKRAGIEAEFIEVFVSRKLPDSSASLTDRWVSSNQRSD